MVIDTKIFNTHEKYFSEKNTIFILKDNAEVEEQYYCYKYKELMQIGGHYVYYEKNAAMQSYMITARKKTVQTGAKITGKLLQTGARGVTLLMIAIIAFNIFKNFWSCYPVYGSLATAVNAKNYTLGAFLGVAAFLLIMEIIFFLWALTGPCAYGDRGTKRVDTGRGLFSFLFIGITVIAAGMFWNLIPSSPSPLTGLAGGLQLYGSLKGILLPLCGIGLVSCIIRKIFS